MVNPARAGMIPHTGALGPTKTGKPRASGDDPGIKKLVDGVME